MLNEPVSDAPLAAGQAAGLPGGAGQLPSFLGSAQQLPDDASYISVTQEEKQAIDRVSQMFICQFVNLVSLLATFIYQ